MTIAVDLGRKATKQPTYSKRQKKQKKHAWYKNPDTAASHH